ncbi:DUF6563 family protein [Maribellus maritimus]|uniref:DUF6563 family protein n=1 Tax=Maribellus maritimus TaxID=2870838 RepID=UPI001EEC4469|nr:DUF6563 family protein [Maribellus maritimus]MCG6190478.1 hypothetical protein [Maribellus maritimus]
MNTKKLKLIIYLLVTTFASSFGQQQNYPKGAYMSFDEIVNKTPSQQYDFDVERRTNGDIKMVGGNDYKISSADKSIKKKFIKKEMWAYSNGDTLYINCFQYKIQPWYASVISDGKYLVVRAGLSQLSDEQKEQMAMASYFGAIGGAIAGAKMAMMRFLYIIDKSTNEISTVTPELLEKLLADDKEQLAQYNNEEAKDSEETMLKYLKLLNK